MTTYDPIHPWFPHQTTELQGASITYVISVGAEPEKINSNEKEDL